MILFYHVTLSPSFLVEGRKHRYFLRKLKVLNTERIVEVPIAISILSDVDAQAVLEVGNVMSNYGVTGHTVVDKYDVQPGVINEDVVQFHPPRYFVLVLSVSTLEHVGFDEVPRQGGKVGAAIRNLRGLLSPEGRLVITVPLGYNPEVDELLRNRQFSARSMTFLMRKNVLNDWVQVTEDEAWTSERLASSRTSVLAIVEYSYSEY